MEYTTSELKHRRCCCRDCLETVCNWLWVQFRLCSGSERVETLWKNVSSLYLTSSHAHHQFTLFPSQIHGWNWVLLIFSICSPSGSQAVGLTAWEATANLSLRVYLLHATLHELRHRDGGRCVLWWVAVDGPNMELPLIKHELWKNLRKHFMRMSKALCWETDRSDGNLVCRRAGSEWELRESWDFVREVLIQHYSLPCDENTINISDSHFISITLCCLWCHCQISCGLRCFVEGVSYERPVLCIVALEIV